MEEEALNFAKQAHMDQQRKYNKEPYIEHPKRVAEIVRTVSHSQEMICAAYLHDVVEDTWVTIEEIDKRFGKKVAQLVNELTDEYIKANYQQMNRRRRKEKEVERQAKMSAEAKTVKLADVIDNTRDIVKNDPGFAKKYVREMEALTNALQGGDNILYEQAHKEIQLGKEILNIS